MGMTLWVAVMMRVGKDGHLALKRVAVVCLVGLVVSSCGWTERMSQANETYRQNVESWIGEPLELLLKAWGTPEEIIDVDGITRAFSWRNEVPSVSTAPDVFISLSPFTRVKFYGGRGSHAHVWLDWSLRFPVRVREDHWVCETIFMITDGRVRDASFQGNDCKPRKKYPAVETANGANQ